MKSCNNCVWLGRDCIVEPEDKRRSAENCDQYRDYGEYYRRQMETFERTGEYWDSTLD